MVKALIAALILGVGSAPAVVAWCLTLCAPAAATPAAAEAGHCALHVDGGPGGRLTPPGMEGCATAHQSGDGLVDAKSPDGTAKLPPPSVPGQALAPPAPVTRTRLTLARFARLIRTSGPLHTARSACNCRLTCPGDGCPAVATSRVCRPLRAAQTRAFTFLEQVMAQSRRWFLRHLMTATGSAAAVSSAPAQVPPPGDPHAAHQPAAR